MMMMMTKNKLRDKLPKMKFTGKKLSKGKKMQSLESTICRMRSNTSIRMKRRNGLMTMTLLTQMINAMKSNLSWRVQPNQRIVL